MQSHTLYAGTGSANPSASDRYQLVGQMRARSNLLVYRHGLTKFACRPRLSISNDRRRAMRSASESIKSCPPSASSFASRSLCSLSAPVTAEPYPAIPYGHPRYKSSSLLDGDQRALLALCSRREDPVEPLVVTFVNRRRSPGSGATDGCAVRHSTLNPRLHSESTGRGSTPATPRKPV